MRHFLQSEKVSQRLPAWIDLIFGAKSRGEAAIESKNLFHPLCYIAHDETEQMDSGDQIEREAAVACVINFGQCCHQIFKNLHPIPLKRFGREHLMSDPSLLTHQRLNPGIEIPNGEIRPRGDAIVTASKFGALLPVGEISIENGIVYTNGRVIEKGILGAVSAVCVSTDGVWLGVGQSESGMVIWLLSYENGEVASLIEIGRFRTAGSVRTCAISAEHFLAIAVCGEVIDRVDLGTRREVEPIEAGFEVNCVAIDDQAAVVIGGGQNCLTLWRVSGALFARVVTESPVSSVAVSELPETAENRFFVTGHSNGGVKFWVVNFETITIVTIYSIRVTIAPIQRLGIGEGATRAIIVSENEMFCLDYRGSPVSNLRKHYAIECGECGMTPLRQGVKVCVNCHRFLCQNCLPKELGFQLGQLAAAPGAAKFRILCPQCASVRKYKRESEEFA
jgi:hypothetical protein